MRLLMQRVMVVFAALSAVGLIGAPASAATVYAGAGAVPFDHFYGGGLCPYFGFAFLTSGAFTDSNGVVYRTAEMDWQATSCSFGGPSSTAQWSVFVSIGPCHASGIVFDAAGVLAGTLNGSCSTGGSVVRGSIVGNDDGQSVVGVATLQADVAA